MKLFNNHNDDDRRSTRRDVCNTHHLAAKPILFVYISSDGPTVVHFRAYVEVSHINRVVELSSSKGFTCAFVVCDGHKHFTVPQ